MPRTRDSAVEAEQSVTYAAVGATQAPDLLQYPPRGYRPLQLRSRIGHGDARWQYAVDELLTAGIYRGAGMGLRLTPAPPVQTENAYHPVTFGEDGEPEAPAELAPAEQVYTADGRPLLRPGDEITVGLAVGTRLWFPLPTRVVLLEQSDEVVTYAVGTLPGHAFRGEEAFTLDRTPDGSVWLTVRSFARPAKWWGWLAFPVLLTARVMIAERFLTALAGPIPTRDA